MRPFKDLSIRWKLKLIILLISGIALLFASGSLMYGNIVMSRNITRDDLLSLAQVIGMNSIGAIVFNDQQTAEINLAALQAKPYVALACIYDRKGEVFATYIHKDTAPEVSVPELREPGHYYVGGYLLVFNPVMQSDDVIGTVCIQYDLKGMRQETLQLAAIFGIILCITFLIIWVLSAYMQKVISRPILSLTRIARTVSEKKDFSVRVEKHSKDEIGVLIGVFNDMLAGIQSRDEKLREYREHLEEQVADRTMDLIQANELLQAAKESAEAANRAKSEFLANMSHEIRTPMNTVLGFTELLSSLITDKRERSYLDAIASSGKGLLALINGILDLSKIEAGKMELQKEPVNLHAVFDEVQHIFALQASEKSIDFTVNLDPAIPDSMMLDEVRLKQILFNLIGNAVKFTPKGYVRVSAKKGASTAAAAPDGIPLRICVEDSGIGIPAQFHDEIFEAFKQKDGQSTKRFGGTGLGLSITKRLVEMMGGTITVHSTEGQGSRFVISISHVQLAEGDIKPDMDTAFNPEEIAFQEAKILVADDVPTNRRLIREFVRSAPITLIEAENGEQAVALAQKHKPDAILMDLRMPVISGVEAMKRIALDEATQSIPVIALTASSMKGEMEKMMSQGFAGYLTKPIRKATLFRELSRFIPHRREGQIPEVKAYTAQEVFDIERLPKVIDALKNTYMQIWKKTMQNRFFDAIGEFADQIIRLGEENSVQMLQTYGEDLRTHVDNFDVENMNATLDAYPELIDTIKAISAQKVKENRHGLRR